MSETDLYSNLFIDYKFPFFSDIFIVNYIVDKFISSNYKHIK